jgi:hypothetical protein
MKFLYPGHRYLGPGNPLENGIPVDTADRIAQIHDIEYNQASSESDIFDSDTKAIFGFSQDFVRQPNLPSLAGAFGLTLKHGVEKNLTGVLYPTGDEATIF